MTPPPKALFNWQMLDGHRFQALCVDLLLQDGFDARDQGVGTDGGVDILAIQNVLLQEGYAKAYTWAVQAKFKQNPHATVKPSELGNIGNILARFEADGFLLITNGRVTSKTFAEIRAISEGSPPTYLSNVWDNRVVEAKLLAQTKIRERYFGHGPNRTILILEDSEPQRDALSRTLERVGHRVFSTASVTDAIRCIETEPVDVAILDIRLDDENAPSATGFDVADELRQASPDTRIIFHSAYLASDEYRARAGLQNAVFLSKFQDTPSTVQEAVESSLASTSRSHEAVPMLQAAGHVVGAVVHQTANALATARYLLAEAKASNSAEDAHDHLAEAMSSLDSATTFLKQLIAPAEREQMQLQDVNEIVEEAVGLAQPRARKPEVQIQLQPEGLPARCIRSSIVLALVNIVTNALQAVGSSEDGRVQVTTDVVRRERDFVAVRIYDSGVGIPEEFIPKLYESGYSTKTEGLGFGFYLSNRVVQAHNGWIDVESPSGAWSTQVTVYLPLANKQTSADADS